MNNNLQPVNPGERRTAETVQHTANQVISRALVELRRADSVKALGNQLLTLMTDEIKDHRELTNPYQIMAEALRHLNDAEREIRMRGEART